MDKFIDEIIKKEKVFFIELKNELAVSQSLLFQINEEPVPVVCFWCTKQQALECCIDVWEDYKIQEICLSTFIEDYLVNIYNESLIVGIDFNKKMEGIEADPLDVILNLITKIKQYKIELEFEYFKNLTDLENQLLKLRS